MLVLQAAYYAMLPMIHVEADQTWKSPSEKLQHFGAGCGRLSISPDMACMMYCKCIQDDDGWLVLHEQALAVC